MDSKRMSIDYYLLNQIIQINLRRISSEVVVMDQNSQATRIILIGQLQEHKLFIN